MLFAVIDVPVQRFLFAKNQRMSKQEIKEEHKSSEGRPEVKASASASCSTSWRAAA